jgi:DNA repair exonuclease SbcCD ATPase subunit
MVPKCLNHSTKASEIFCFEDNCCLCSVCALLKHKDHDILDINEATKRIQKEIMSFSTKEEIKIIEESIEKINKEISKRNEKFEKDLENLKEDHMKDLDVLGDSKLKLQENLNTLEEFERKLKSSNILTLLKMKKDFNFVSQEISEFLGGKEIYSFGLNSKGQLGLGNTINQNIPQLISFFKNEKIKNIACGGSHAIIQTGELKFN